jgi:hypothetical protein
MNPSSKVRYNTHVSKDNTTSLLKPISSISLLNTSDDKYYYPTHILNKNIHDISIYAMKTVNICIFNVNTQSTSPYLSYLLSKINNVFYWPHFTPSKDSVLEECNDKLDILGISPVFDGYVKHRAEIYMFYRLDVIDKEISIQKDEPFWWVTMYEILLSKRVINDNVHDSVGKVFHQKPKLKYLYSESGIKQPYPIIGYVSKQKQTNQVGWIERKNGSMGNYYYFYDIDSIKNSSNIDNKIILRYAIHTGNQKVLDELIISDDDNWTDQYDSLLYNHKSQMMIVIDQNDHFNLLSYTS